LRRLTLALQLTRVDLQRTWRGTCFFSLKVELIYYFADIAIILGLDTMDKCTVCFPFFCPLRVGIVKLEVDEFLSTTLQECRRTLPVCKTVIISTPTVSQIIVI
jgi:hypothetical protein